MEVASDTELLNLELVGAHALGSAAERMVLRVSEVEDVAGVGAELAGECLCLQRRVLGSGVAVQPGEIGERKWNGGGWRLRRRGSGGSGGIREGSGGRATDGEQRGDTRKQ